MLAPPLHNLLPQSLLLPADHGESLQHSLLRRSLLRPFVGKPQRTAYCSCGSFVGEAAGLLLTCCTACRCCYPFMGKPASETGYDGPCCCILDHESACCPACCRLLDHGKATWQTAAQPAATCCPFAGQRLLRLLRQSLLPQSLLPVPAATVLPPGSSGSRGWSPPVWTRPSNLQESVHVNRVLNNI